MKKVNVGVIGAGNMGEAIIRGLQKEKDFAVYVYEKDKARLQRILKKYYIKKIELKQLTKLVNIIIICVKPQDMDGLILGLREYVNSKHLLISIAAGIKTSHIENCLKIKAAVVRVMPNLPGAIGQGVSAYFLGKNAGKKDANFTKQIFKTMGEVFEVTKEDKMNAVTAISGSGPGFMAYYISALQEAAVEVGFNKKEARLLAVSASVGTANMIIQENIDPVEFVTRVTSKGGTTEAGLKIFKKENIKKTVKNAAKAAEKRAKELNKE